ncbi:MAG: arginine--tRNA ligase [Candidatus Thermoplasmatota archaeon]
MDYCLKQAKKQISESIQRALEKLGYKHDVVLETPPEELGDYAFPCFPLAPIAKKSPDQIAKEIKNSLTPPDWVENIEAKGGYVNFFLNTDKFKKQVLKNILNKKEKYGFLENKKKKVIVEHTSANPNGPLHVGRARNPIIGDTVARILKAAGYNVETQFYVDDMGKQVAILTWGANNLSEKEVEQTKKEKPDHKMVSFYQKANQMMNENEEIADEISDIVKKTEEGNTNAIELVHKTYNPVLKGIKQSLSDINISIDSFIPESKFVKNKSVEKALNKLKKTDYCGREGNAFYLDLEPFGVKGRNTKFFLTREDGTTLYATRDIAYHLWKINKSDMLVNILGEDHKLESKQVKTALKLLKAEISPHIIFYSFVALPEGKMSTRKGRVVYLDDLIDEIIKRAQIEVKKRRGNELHQNKINKISKQVGIGALRYNIIKVQPEKNIVFKWEEALNFEGNASPFIQYSYARANSILSKKQGEIKNFDPQQLTHQSEINLLKQLSQLPLVIEEAAENFKPHLIPNYLFETASAFNQFYRDCPVLSAENEELKNTRLKMVEATCHILKNGLKLLGIESPREM